MRISDWSSDVCSSDLPTAEGFYRVQVPIGAGKYTAAIQFGALCEWVQVQDASVHKLAELDRACPTPGAAVPTVAEGMRAAATGLYEAEPPREIGSASLRERFCQYRETRVGADTLKK